MPWKEVHIGLLDINTIPSLSHLVYINSSFSSQIKQHFLQEPQPSFTIHCAEHLTFFSYYNCIIESIFLLDWTVSSRNAEAMYDFVHYGILST